MKFCYLARAKVRLSYYKNRIFLRIEQLTNFTCQIFFFEKNRSNHPKSLICERFDKKKSKIIRIILFFWILIIVDEE